MRKCVQGLRKASAVMGGGTQAAEKVGRLLGDALPVKVVFLLSLALAAWLIYQIRARFRDRADSAAEERQMLSQWGELHREGGLSQEEFRSIKGRLTQRV